MTEAKTTDEERKALSPDRGAFVIQFRSCADVEEGQFTGRAEHVASGQVTRFRSPENLLVFIRRVLAELRQGEPQDGG